MLEQRRPGVVQLDSNVLSVAQLSIIAEVAMAESSKQPLGFDLNEAQLRALSEIAGSRRVRLTGKVVGGRFQVDFVACNAPFIACNAPFVACNAPFTACNAPFKE